MTRSEKTLAMRLLESQGIPFQVIAFPEATPVTVMVFDAVDDLDPAVTVRTTMYCPGLSGMNVATAP